MSVNYPQRFRFNSFVEGLGHLYILKAPQGILIYSQAENHCSEVSRVEMTDLANSSSKLNTLDFLNICIKSLALSHALILLFPCSLTLSFIYPINCFGMTVLFFSQSGKNSDPDGSTWSDLGSLKLRTYWCKSGMAKGWDSAIGFPFPLQLVLCGWPCWWKGTREA